MVPVAGGTGLKQGRSIVCCNAVCGNMSEAILSPRKPSQAHGCRLIWSEKREFHALFLEVISHALIISLEGRRRKLLLLLLLFPLFSIRSILERKQTGTKRQQGPTQKNKSADLIRLLCLSLTKRALSLPPRQEGAPTATTSVSLI